MPVSLKQFRERLEESGLLSADEIRALESSAPREKLTPDDAQPFAKVLVSRRVLTAYQATVIYQGKPRELVYGTYVVLDKLGQGGMGMVFKAQHRRMKRTVALKVMAPAAMKSPDAVKRFHREVQAAARLTHPNIVAAFDADETRGVHFLVMEYVSGSDLASLVRKQGPLAVDKAVDCIMQAARGLEHAHNEGVVHRDIKPANLLLDKSGTVKVLDMGLARVDQSPGAEAATAAGLTQTGSIMGTVDYMSPEQALNTKYADRRADIYSLGCSLSYLLTGSPVYSGESLMERLLAHRDQPIPSLRVRRADVSESLDAVFAKMIAKRPEDRYQSMADVLRDLAACSAGNPVVHAVPAAGFDPAGPGSAESALAEFLGNISPAATATAVRTKVEAVAGETLATQATARTQTSLLKSVAGKVSQLTNGRQALIGGGAAAGVVVIALALWIGLKDSTERKGGEGQAEQQAESVAASTTSSDAGRKANETRRATPDSEPVSSNDTPAGSDWVTIFNGNDLSGWRDVKGGPPKWKVENGYVEIVPRSGWITTTEKFGPDIELHAEFWIPKIPGAKGQARGNSGIFLLGRHEIQILDMVDNPGVKPDQGCGALFGVIAAKPGGIKPPDTWQTFDIKYSSPRRDADGANSTPGRLTVVMNGAPVIENAPFDVAATGGSLNQEVATPGPIVLQDHGVPVRFRNLRVRNLAPSADSDSKLLFDGETLSGWSAVGGGGWWAKNGVLTADGKGTGWLMTNDEYGDFELDLEYKLPPGGNSGVFLRAWPEGAVNGGQFLEIQLLDDDDSRWGKIGGDRKTAAIFGCAAPSPVPRTPTGQWHRMQIRAAGRRVSVTVNGQQVLNANLDDFPAKFQQFPGLKRDRGRIGLQLHQTGVEFRNIRVRDLSNQQAAVPPNVGKPAIVPADGAVDLLAAVDVARDAISGEWSLTGGALSSTQLPETPRTNALAFPVEVAGDYVLELDFVRTSGENGLNVVLPVGATAVGFFLAAFPGHPKGGPSSGLQRVDNQALPTSPQAVRGISLETGRTYHVAFRVASAGGEATISTSLDGKEIHRWTGAVERISPPPMYALRTTRTPGLGIIKCAFEYRHVRLRMTRGEAKWVTEVSRTTGHSSSET